MTELDYLESIDQRLEAIYTDTNAIVGEIPQYLTDLTYSISGEKYLEEIVERQNAQITGLYLIATILATILIWNYIVRCWK